MQALLFGFVVMVSSSSATEVARTLTCDGVTIYSNLLREDGVAMLTMEYRSPFLNRRKQMWGWGDVRRDRQDPWVVTAWAEFTWGDTIMPTVRTRRTAAGDLVADIDWFHSEHGNFLKTDVPCVFDAPPPPTLAESCVQLLFKDRLSAALLQR